MKVEVLYRKGVHILTNESKGSDTRKGLLINLKMPNILFLTIASCVLDNRRVADMNTSLPGPLAH